MHTIEYEILSIYLLVQVCVINVKAQTKEELFNRDSIG